MRPLLEWLRGGPPPPPQAGLAAAAVEQGLAGLLDDALPPGAPGWPPAERDRLRAAHRAALAHGVRLLESGRRAAELLAARGLRSLALKGAAVAPLYDSPGHRPMADADVLVLDDWTGALAALREAGFVEEERAAHARLFRDPETRGAVELHHALCSCPRLFPLDGEGVWRRAGGGAALRLPAPEDLAVHLAIHAAFQHGLRLRLVQWLDLRRLFERTAIDPARLLERARAAGAVAALAATLGEAERLVGVPVPETLRHALDGPAPPAPSWPLLRVRWAISAGRRLRFVLDTLAPAEPGGAKPGWRRVVPALGRAARRLGDARL